jgi:hypothetical protein
MFEYNLTIGEYNDDVRVSIGVKVKQGLSPEDYTKLRAALNEVEEITRKYQLPVEKTAE